MRGLVDDLPYSRWKLQLMQREEAFGPSDWNDSALLGALEALQSGITTIADITSTGAAAHAAHQASLRGRVFHEVATMEKGEVPSTMSRAAENIAAWREAGSGDLLQIGIAPHSPYSVHPNLFKAVAEYASDGTPVAMHLAGSREEYQFVKYGSSILSTEVRDEYDRRAPLWLPTGVSPVRYVLQWGLFDVPDIMAVHLTQVDDSDIEVLATRNVSVAHCPRCNAKLAMGTAPVRKLVGAGIRVGLGTDSPAAANSMDMFEEMRIGLLVQRAVRADETWMPARQIVKMATLDGARVLGMEDRIGTLESGKQADIIAIDLSKSHQIPTHYPYGTIVHTANQENILMTMVAGRVLYENRTWNVLDPERLFARAEEMRLKLRPE
jgi:5-methylthioadenosine/S-adenosylhomocysteine deaminase